MDPTTCVLALLALSLPPRDGHLYVPLAQKDAHARFAARARVVRPSSDGFSAELELSLAAMHADQMAFEQVHAKMKVDHQQWLPSRARAGGARHGEEVLERHRMLLARHRDQVQAMLKLTQQYRLGGASETQARALFATICLAQLTLGVEHDALAREHKRWVQSLVSSLADAGSASSGGP